jgi:hypothetical protein
MVKQFLVDRESFSRFARLLFIRRTNHQKDTLTKTKTKQKVSSFKDFLIKLFITRTPCRLNIGRKDITEHILITSVSKY